MALFVEGTECPLCGRPIYRNQEPILFPPFVSNQADPLWLFSDGVFHSDCFLRHPLADSALARLARFKEHSKIWPPFCALCHNRIDNPDQHFTFGHLTDDDNNPLKNYNYLHLHKDCMRNWQELSDIYNRLVSFQQSGLWQGSVLHRMIAEIDKIRALN